MSYENSNTSLIQIYSDLYNNLMKKFVVNKPNRKDFFYKLWRKLFIKGSIFKKKISISHYTSKKEYTAYDINEITNLYFFLKNILVKNKDNVSEAPIEIEANNVIRIKQDNLDVRFISDISNNSIKIDWVVLSDPLQNTYHSPTKETRWHISVDKIECRKKRKTQRDIIIEGAYSLLRIVFIYYIDMAFLDIEKRFDYE